MYKGHVDKAKGFMFEGGRLAWVHDGMKIETTVLE